MKKGIKFDYSKLLGRIKEKGYTLNEIAKFIGLAHSTFSLRLSGEGFFRQPEIIKLCDVLEIPYKEIPLYFFIQKV